MKNKNNFEKQIVDFRRSTKHALGMGPAVHSAMETLPATPPNSALVNPNDVGSGVGRACSVSGPERGRASCRLSMDAGRTMITGASHVNAFLPHSFTFCLPTWAPKDTKSKLFCLQTGLTYKVWGEAPVAVASIMGFWDYRSPSKAILLRIVIRCILECGNGLWYGEVMEPLATLTVRRYTYLYMVIVVLRALVHIIGKDSPGLPLPPLLSFTSLLPLLLLPFFPWFYFPYFPAYTRAPLPLFFRLFDVFPSSLP